MTNFLLILLLTFTTGESYSAPAGVIRGAVINGSRSDNPIADAKVILQAGENGILEPVGQTTTDKGGNFRFDDIPIDPSVTFSIGAERDGIHYPASRFQLNTTRRSADVRIRAFDSVNSPSPLQALHHRIDIAVHDKLILVKESLRIANRSTATYVGQSAGDAPPTTLRLAIPPNFDRVTFASEFHGRRFRVVEHQLVTDIPWPPGEREIAFAYQIPLEESAGLFRRVLDLPTEDLAVRVLDGSATNLKCNLVTARRTNHDVLFTASDQLLPASFAVELQIGEPPIPWAKYARWGALTLLGGLILATLLVGKLRGSGIARRQPSEPHKSGRANRVGQARQAA